MVFPFTFKFNVSGLFNPFASTPVLGSKQGARRHQSPDSCHTHSQAAPPVHHPISHPIQIPQTSRRISRANLPKINRPRPSPSPSPAPISRKRGWEPDPSPTWSTTSLTLASTSGYLDTPAKYREMAASDSRMYGPEGNEDITMSDDYERRQAQAEDDGEYYQTIYFLFYFVGPTLVYTLFFCPFEILWDSERHAFSLILLPFCTVFASNRQSSFAWLGLLLGCVMFKIN